MVFAQSTSHTQCFTAKENCTKVKILQVRILVLELVKSYLQKLKDWVVQPLQH